MKSSVPTLAVVAALGTVPAMAGPNQSSCTGTNRPDGGGDKGGSSGLCGRVGSGGLSGFTAIDLQQ